MCQIREAEIRLSSMVAQNIVREEKSRFLNCSMLSMLPNINPVDFRLLLVLQLMKSQQHNSFTTNTALVSNEPQFHAISSMITSSEAMPNTSSLSCFMPLAEASSKKDPETVDSFTKLRPSISENTSRLNASTTESLVPSTDKEGWCRNKKYIKRVPNGFMCTVCRKTYGRYNSVSYHVTIYHRNPPIKCDEKGCQFTTREARYIHFHKYYRHHIALPDSIDLGSRKCPFCRHVSKSPAMLEKHINRHLPNGNRVGRSFKCTKCTISLDSQAKLHEHLSTHHRKHFIVIVSIFRGRTSKNLEQHKLFKHSEEMFKKMIICPECGFKCSTESVLLLHSEQVHKSSNADCAERNADADLTDDKNTASAASAAVYGLDNRRIVNDDDQPICLVKPKK
uniref:C2H2-type domain-containing protein n=1 Tax=Syphacia muris TaxID=451379 RepID=A0A0N5AN98_9BILA